MAVPQPPWQERLKPTIVFILPLVLLVALAWFIRMNSDNNPMRFTMEVAEPVLIEPGIPVVPLDLTLRLQNRTREGIDVIAESQCHALRWFLLDDSGSFIQSDPMEGCQPGAIADHVGAETTLVHTATIPLDAGRLIPGERYHLVVAFWGYEKRERFRVRQGG